MTQEAAAGIACGPGGGTAIRVISSQSASMCATTLLKGSSVGRVYHLGDRPKIGSKKAKGLEHGLVYSQLAA